jgi:hypothetical protein
LLVAARGFFEGGAVELEVESEVVDHRQGGAPVEEGDEERRAGRGRTRRRRAPPGAGRPAARATTSGRASWGGQRRQGRWDAGDAVAACAPT